MVDLNVFKKENKTRSKQKLCCYCQSLRPHFCLILIILRVLKKMPLYFKQVLQGN